MKKLVLKIDMPDDAAKRKAMKTVAAFPGIDSISVDMKDMKLTIIGTVDPTKVVSRLRKYWTTELVTVGPAKEPEKIKEDPKKDDAKPAAPADESKKDGGAGGEQEKKKPAEEAKKEAGGDGGGGGGGGGEVKKETEAAVKAPNAETAAAGGGGGEKKEEELKKVDPVLEMVRAYRAYNPHMTKYYYAQSMEENPNACVIC